ncbi:acyl-CoA thioesterase [Eubacteriales bacterium OttesenSCG-928-M02]|nr:acyl-CoA thioesterase [Eubacteriales bacterium OttesenSCG-928-M02]
MANSKPIRDSITEQVHVVMASDINGAGRLFGGQLIQWIDVVAGVAARRHADAQVTTASIDTLQFLAPAYANDVILLIARVTYVGTTSMEVRVDTYVEKLSGEREQINQAYLVMVALDDMERPIPVPRLDLATEEEHKEWLAGQRRHKLRQQRRKEGF